MGWAMRGSATRLGPPLDYRNTQASSWSPNVPLWCDRRGSRRGGGRETRACAFRSEACRLCISYFDRPMTLFSRVFAQNINQKDFMPSFRMPVVRTIFNTKLSKTAVKHLKWQSCKHQVIQHAPRAMGGILILYTIYRWMPNSYLQDTSTNHFNKLHHSVTRLIQGLGHLTALSATKKKPQCVQQPTQRMLSWSYQMARNAPTYFQPKLPCMSIVLIPQPCKSTTIIMLDTTSQHDSNFHTHPHTTGTPSSPLSPIIPNSSLVHVCLTIAFKTFMSTWLSISKLYFTIECKLNSLYSCSMSFRIKLGPQKSLNNRVWHTLLIAYCSYG